MIPVETPSPWWRVALDLLDHWQTLSAGAFALVAAIITLLVTWRAERRHARREWKPSGPSFDSKSTEHSTSMRPPRPVSHVRRADQRKDGGEQVTNARSDHLFSDAGKIGLLQGDAMGVVIIYTTPEGGRSRTDRLATAYNTPDDMSPDVVMETADVFLAACGHAQVVLPRLRTGDASYEDQDEALLQKIKAALAAGQV